MIFVDILNQIESKAIPIFECKNIQKNHFFCQNRKIVVRIDIAALNEGFNAKNYTQV